MPRPLTKDYGPHEAGTAPEFDPERTAWLERHGYLEPDPAAHGWPLKTPPDAYLERYPDGPQAELARQILSGAPPEAVAEEIGRTA